MGSKVEVKKIKNGPSKDLLALEERFNRLEEKYRELMPSLKKTKFHERQEELVWRLTDFRREFQFYYAIKLKLALPEQEKEIERALENTACERGLNHAALNKSLDKIAGVDVSKNSEQVNELIMIASEMEIAVSQTANELLSEFSSVRSVVPPDLHDEVNEQVFSLLGLKTVLSGNDGIIQIADEVFASTNKEEVTVKELIEATEKVMEIRLPRRPEEASEAISWFSRREAEDLKKINEEIKELKARVKHLGEAFSKNRDKYVGRMKARNRLIIDYEIARDDLLKKAEEEQATDETITRVRMEDADQARKYARRSEAWARFVDAYPESIGGMLSYAHNLTEAARHYTLQKNRDEAEDCASTALTMLDVVDAISIIGETRRMRASVYNAIGDKKQASEWESRYYFFKAFEDTMTIIPAVARSGANYHKEWTVPPFNLGITKIQDGHNKAYSVKAGKKKKKASKWDLQDAQ